MFTLARIEGCADHTNKKYDLTILQNKLHQKILEMGPDPTRAYIWLTFNKRLTRLWPGYFSTQPEAIFFDPKGKKLKNLTFLGEIFQILTQTINGWPDLTRPEPQKIDPTRVKKF